MGASLILLIFDSQRIIHVRSSIWNFSSDLISELRERVRYIFNTRKRNSIPTKNHELFCLLCKHTNEDVFDDFPKISDHFPKILQKLSECQTNATEHFSKISEDKLRFPKIIDDCRRLARKIRSCFYHTAIQLSTVKEIYYAALAVIFA